MMRKLAILSLAIGLVLGCHSAPCQAGSVIQTDVTITILDPPGTTFTGLELTYDSADITGLTLLSGAPTTFTTNGIDLVDVTFAAVTSIAFSWRFATLSDLVANIGIDITGESSAISGVEVNVILTAIPEPSSVVMFGTGMIGAAFFVRRRFSRLGAR